MILIDNIFTSELEYNTDSGFVINDISDNLSIFAMCKCNIANNISSSSNRYTHHISDDNFNVLKISITKHSYKTVLNDEDANLAYYCFLNTFRKLYNKKH